MSKHTTQLATPRPASEAYDAIPRVIQGRDDLTFGAKCLYGALQTAERTRWQPTYEELATHLSASTRSIVRWVAQLAAAGLIAVKRRGQGLSNLIRVLALVVSGSDIRSAPKVTDWQRRAPSPFNKEGRPNKGYNLPARSSSDLMMTRYGRYRR